MPEHTTQLEDSSNEDEEPLPTVLNLDRASRLGKGKQPHQTQLRNQHPTLDDEFFSIINFNKEIEADEAQQESRTLALRNGIKEKLDEW